MCEMLDDWHKQLFQNSEFWEENKKNKTTFWS